MSRTSSKLYAWVSSASRVLAGSFPHRVCPFKVALLARHPEDTREKAFDVLHEWALNSAGVRHCV
jgi:hypothetical protein